MFDLILSRISALLSVVPFKPATWSVILILGFFTWLFSRANKNPDSPIKWEHLIIDNNLGQVSPYKMGYLVGGLVGTWIVVSMADTGSISFDILGLYLTYLLGGASMSNFFSRGTTNIPPASPSARDISDDPTKQNP